MEVIERSFLSQDWITLLFLLCFILIGLMKLYKPQLLLGYTIAFFSQGFIEKRAEKNPSIFTPFHILLYLFNSIIVSITITVYFSKHREQNFLRFISLFAFIFMFLSTKLILNYFLAHIFDIEKKIRYFLFTKSGYQYTLSIWLLPILVFYQYWYSNVTMLLVFIALLLIFRVFLIIKNNKKLIFSNFFYFILYFCTLELAPLLIIYKTTKI